MKELSLLRGDNTGDGLVQEDIQELSYDKENGIKTINMNLKFKQQNDLKEKSACMQYVKPQH